LSRKQEIRVFYSRLSLAWGFIVRLKNASASQPSYLLPPPPTIVGSLAYAFARYLDIREPKVRKIKYREGIITNQLMKAFLESTLVASASVVGNIGLATHMEPGKIIASMYKTGDNQIRTIKEAKPGSDVFYKEAIPLVLPVLAQGATYGPAELEILWAFDAARLSEMLGKEVGYELSIEEIDREMPRALLGATRLGSKESIVAVDASSMKYSREPRILSVGDVFTTRLYVPVECVESTVFTQFTSIQMYDLDYVEKSFYIPFATEELSSGNTVLPKSSTQLKLLPKLSIRGGCIGVTPDDDLYREGLVGVSKVRL